MTSRPARAVCSPSARGSMTTIRTSVPSADWYVTCDAVTRGVATAPGDFAQVDSSSVAAS